MMALVLGQVHAIPVLPSPTDTTLLASAAPAHAAPPRKLRAGASIPASRCLHAQWPRLLNLVLPSAVPPGTGRLLSPVVLLLLAALFVPADGSKQRCPAYMGWRPAGTFYALDSDASPYKGSRILCTWETWPVGRRKAF